MCYLDWQIHSLHQFVWTEIFQGRSHQIYQTLLQSHPDTWARGVYDFFICKHSEWIAQKAISFKSKRVAAPMETTIQTHADTLRLAL